MMKQQIVALLGVTIMSVVACSSTEKKAEPAPVAAEPEAAPVANARSADMGGIDAANAKLAKVAVVGLPAFAKSGADASAKDSLATVKEVIAELPEGYVVEITGHHNQHPDKSKRQEDGKGGLSRQRAKDVYNYFVKNGIAKEKLTYRGVGSSEYDESLSREKNRRVTFKAVKAGG